MRIALAQLNFTVGAFEANFDKMRLAVEQARRARAGLVVFSEMAATGYPPRDLLNHAEFVRLNLDLVDRLAELTDETFGILVGFVDPNPSTEGKRLYNAAAFCHRGRVEARRHKCLLPTYDVFDEDRYFEPARTVAPIDFQGVRLGVTICEDVWNDKKFWPERLYHRDPVDELVTQGAELLINISSSPFSLGKPEIRRQMIRQKAIKHGQYFFYLNQVGGNDELVFDGHSLGFDPVGEVVLRANDFDEDLLVYEVPDAALKSQKPAPGNPGIVREVSVSEVEEAHKALVLGLRDYTRKCGFSSVVLGLSGGIDSALTASLAADALGSAHVLGLSMPTRYSSDHSLTDAAALAAALGIEYRVLPIDSIFQAYLDALGPMFAGLRPDAAEENIQARIRGAVLMAISNKLGKLVLSTGNKSELAVGFCTLYGDMCGGLDVLNDVPKTFVYELAHFVNHDREIIPRSTLTKPPSAELSPGQLDTDTLPPWDIVDRVIEAYVERDEDVDTIVASGIEGAVVIDIVRRINLNEYKRRQAAPGIKITSKAFGVGRRYPIAADYRPLLEQAAVRIPGTAAAAATTEERR